jgi:hypothetical protein
MDVLPRNLSRMTEESHDIPRPRHEWGNSRIVLKRYIYARPSERTSVVQAVYCIVFSRCLYVQQ